MAFLEKGSEEKGSGREKGSEEKGSGRLTRHQEAVALLPVNETAAGPARANTSDHEYETFSVQLNPGEEILMYTDGICEATNADGEEFGEPRSSKPFAVPVFDAAGGK